MAAQAEVQFNKRLRRITRRHARMRNGVYHRLNADGLIVAHPRRRAPHFPLQGLIMLLGSGFLFKAFLLVNLGPVTYGERVALLAQGNLIEQGGSGLMQIDPATQWLAQQLAAIF
jgi:hypothetical protein